MEQYFRSTEQFASADMIYISPDSKQTRWMYEKRLKRVIISTLYATGMRRAELIGLKTGDIDFRRRTAKILGKGDKMREIPIVTSLCDEISLYLQSVETMVGGDRSQSALPDSTPRCKRTEGFQ